MTRFRFGFFIVVNPFSGTQLLTHERFLEGKKRIGVIIVNQRPTIIAVANCGGPGGRAWVIIERFVSSGKPETILAEVADLWKSPTEISAPKEEI